MDELENYLAQFQQELYYYLFRRIRNKEDCEDLLQEVYLKAFLAFPSQKILNMGAWLKTIAWEDGDLKRWLEFGLCLYASNQWGNQIGTRACRRWITYLFEQFSEIQHVGFTTWSGNERMMKVGEKLGMKEEARIRKVRYYEGQYFDSVKYGVLREEWRAMDGLSDLGSGR